MTSMKDPQGNKHTSVDIPYDLWLHASRSGEKLSAILTECLRNRFGGLSTISALKRRIAVLASEKKMFQSEKSMKEARVIEVDAAIQHHAAQVELMKLRIEEITLQEQLDSRSLTQEIEDEVRKMAHQGPHLTYRDIYAALVPRYLKEFVREYNRGFEKEIKGVLKEMGRDV